MPGWSNRALIVLPSVVSFLVVCGQITASAQDAIDLMMQRGHVPADISPGHAYSDSSNPVAKFMDFLAAGSFREARSLQSDACAAWRTTPETAAMAGKFWVWNTEINMDTLCAGGGAGARNGR